MADLKTPKRGRPSVADLLHQKLDDIFDRHSDGENLFELCDEHGITQSQFRKRIKESPELQERWVQTRRDYAHSLFTELHRLERQLATTKWGKDDNAQVSAIRTAIDTLKHITARLNPSDYGEQKAGPQSPTIIINTSLPIGPNDNPALTVDGDFQLTVPMLEEKR